MGAAKRKRKARLFDIGVSAFRAAFGDASTLYRCPLCGDGYQRAALGSGELTLDHVPAGAIGGKALVLTCKRCNSESGPPWRSLRWKDAGWSDRRPPCFMVRGSSLTGWTSL